MCHQRRFLFRSAMLWAMIVGALCVSGEASRADDPSIDDRFREMQQRLDRLETENEDLRRSLDAIRPDSEGPSVLVSTEGLYGSTNENFTSEEPSATWVTGWNHGIEWQTTDKQFKVHIGGRTHFDGVWVRAYDDALAGSGTNQDQDAVNFRRARLRMEGTIYGTIDYAAEYDFVNSFDVEPTANDPERFSVNVPAPTDLWFTFRELPLVGNVRMGNQKEPFGFEHMTSSRFLNFMERSYLQDLFAGPNNNGFTPGISAFNTFGNQRGTWAFGGYKNSNTDNVFARNVGNGEYVATGRLTYLLIDDQEEERLLHFAMAGSVRDPDDERIRFRARSLRNGPSNFATVYADTGTFNCDTQWLSGLEFVAVGGPWTLQSEWMGSWISDTSPIATSTNGIPSGTAFIQGWYAEAMCFLTGESREYDRKAGAFGRVIPYRNFYWRNGCYDPGAWQALFRYELADLDDDGLRGGRLEAYTWGVNWFWNPNLKFQFNYVLTVRDYTKLVGAPANVDDGIISGFGVRLAHDF